MVDLMKERLTIEERCRVTPSESVALQAIADELVVSKSSLLRLGAQLVIERHHGMKAMDRLSALAGFDDTDSPG